jgi:replication-associated recombination protein RarA
MVISNHCNIDLNALKSCLASAYISVIANRDGHADLKSAFERSLYGGLA